MNLNANNSKNLCHLTKNRVQVPKKRNPSKQHLRNLFNEQDFQDGSDMQFALSNSKKMSVVKKGPPPQIARKPELPKKPEIPKKPSKAGQLENLHLEQSSLKPSSTSNAFKDSLSKKLTLPTYPVKPTPKIKFEQPPEIGSITQNGNRNSIAKELNGIFSQPKHQSDNDFRRNYDPKSDRTLSLTEVSTLKTEEKSAKNLNDTLDMMTDEGFDMTNEDVGVDLNDEIELSPDEDDDELFAHFNIPPPPPPAMDFSDSEADFNYKEKVSNLCFMVYDYSL